jgi:hypothetical protein
MRDSPSDRRWARLATLALAVAAGSAPAAAQSPGAPAVQLGVTIEPDTVTVGDAFTVRVRIRAPRGSVIAFPAAPDTSAPVQALDPRVVRASPDTAAVDQTATYRLVAWDVGALPLGLADVVVRVGAAERPVTLATERVHVRSVLPADSAARVPKPARDLLSQERPWWLRWWWAIALAALLLGLLVWWWMRRRRRLAALRPQVDPFEQAERDFARVEALGLVEAGERGRFVALMVEVLRDYLARELPPASTSLTSSELLAATTALRSVPRDRLAALLGESDLIKFARRNVAPERARELGREAQAIARHVHDVEHAPAEPPAAAEAA